MSGARGLDENTAVHIGTTHAVTGQSIAGGEPELVGSNSLYINRPTKRTDSRTAVLVIQGIQKFVT
jgi:hypothetical protein